MTRTRLAPSLGWTLATRFAGLTAILMFAGGVGHDLSLRASPPAELGPWLEARQDWVRDVDGPMISLGEDGDFDDRHIFAPAVAFEDGTYRLWYCGARGDIEDRVFRLGLATSDDGREFTRDRKEAVYEFGDGIRSVLTPSLLRFPDGQVRREDDGRLRMWFSAASFRDPSGRHALHETSSRDGIEWSAPSESLLENVYAPIVLRIGRLYQMWFTDVGSEPWIIRHASSMDGTKWTVTPEPVIAIDQDWESGNLFYPAVIKIGDAYLMWYGSYWTGRPDTTALGFAASIDGLKWFKHPQNPVFTPDPERSWESHYTTSQSVMRLADGVLHAAAEPADARDAHVE